MSKIKKNIGVIGCGIIADTHIESIQQFAPGAIISVCDPEPGKAELLRKKYRLHKTYYTINDLIENEKPYSVHILSPPQLHFEHTIQCLEAGCHVLVEKPLAIKKSDVYKLYDVAHRYGKVLCVDHSLLCQPSVIKMLKKLNLDDEKILYINCFYGQDLAGTSYDDLPPTHWKKRMAGSALIDIIIHPLTLAVELSGEPKEIKTNYTENNGQINEVCFYWKGESTMCSLTVSTQAQPFRRMTEIITNKNTYIVDHSTETLVTLNSGFGPSAFKKLYKNVGQGTQLISGSVATVLNVLRGKLKQNPGARGVIQGYYNHLNENAELPVSESNVKNSSLALDSIINSLSNIEKDTKSVLHQKNFKVDTVTEDQGNVTLVTGASGFLGRHICSIMSEAKLTVIAQVRRGINADKLYSPYIRKIYEDFSYCDIKYSTLLNGVKQVVHCAHAAGSNTWESIKKTNVDATIKLYKEARKAGCEKFIFISSVAVYGVHQKGKITVTEKTQTTYGQSPYDFYIHSKALAEKRLIEEASKGGPKLLIIRPGLLYDPNGDKLARRGIPLKKSRLLIRFGRGKNCAPFTRVDILADTICNILEFNKFPKGVYNLVGDIQENKEEFIYRRMKKLCVECKFFTIPSFPAKLCAYFLEKIYSVLNLKSAPKITRYVINSDTRNIIYDSSKAERDLNWNAKNAVAF